MTRDLAVARVSRTQAVRSRLVLGVVLAFGLAVCALAYGVTGDGTLVGRLRVFLSWAVGGEVFLLSMTTVFLSTAVARGLTQGTLTLLAAGPLPRWRLLVGWWLGVVVVLAGTVFLLQLLVGGLTALMILLAPPSSRPALQELLVARGASRPQVDGSTVGERAAERYALLASEGAIPAELSREEALGLLRDELELMGRTVGPRRSLEWVFEGVEPRAGSETVVLRFRYLPQARQGELPPGRGPRGRFHFRFGQGQWFTSPAGSWVGEESHELRLPTAARGDSGQLTIQYESLEDEVVVVFPSGGVEVLYPWGGFAPNLARAGGVLLGRLVFLAALGVGLAVLIEGKLAALVLLAVLLIGSGQAFLLDALRPPLFGYLDAPVKAILHTVLWLLPDFSRDDLGAMLSGGLRVDSAAVWTSCALDGLLRGGICLGGGALLFSRRELGAIQ